MNRENFAGKRTSTDRTDTWKLWTSDLQQTCIPKVVFGMDFRGYLLIISVLVKCRDFYISGVRSVRICPLSIPLKHNIILNRQIQKTTLFTGLYRSCKGKQCLPLSFLQVRVLQNVDHDRLETAHETLYGDHHQNQSHQAHHDVIARLAHVTVQTCGSAEDQVGDKIDQSDRPDQDALLCQCHGIVHQHQGIKTSQTFRKYDLQTGDTICWCRAGVFPC